MANEARDAPAPTSKPGLRPNEDSRKQAEATRRASGSEHPRRAEDNEVGRAGRVSAPGPGQGADVGKDQGRNLKVAVRSPGTLVCSLAGSQLPRAPSRGLLGNSTL